MTCECVMQYRSNAQRPLVAQRAMAWEEGDGLQDGVRDLVQDSASAPAGWQGGWQRAAASGAMVKVLQLQTLQRFRQAVESRHQEGLGLHASGGMLSQQGLAHRVHRVTRQQDALPTWQEVWFAHQDGLRDRRPGRVARHQVAQAMPVGLGTDFQKGAPWFVGWSARYQEAVPPPPGISIRPGPPVDPVEPWDPCYVPDPHLVFRAAAALSGRLLFVCCKGSNPEPPRYVIPLLRVYMTVHTIDAVLLPSLERVPLQTISITTNDDEYGWTMTASGKLSLLDQLAPRQGVPQQIRVTIDGIKWVFLVDPPSRTRKFGEHAVQLTGRSITSLLSAPAFADTAWASTVPRTAQQLVLDALDLTGIGLDWQIDDWLVPENVWSHSGTPLSVAQRIAEAAGAVVRSHRSEPRLQIAPRFPHLPWAWAGAPADVVMPGQIITADSLQPAQAAHFNAVYIAGTAPGRPLGHVTRAGSAGDRLAPQITDALITEVVAARMRGQSVLAASAITHQQPITVPLLTGGTRPGLILPGYLIEVQEPEETWRGLVRGITVSVDAPSIRQALDVERSIA